MRRLLLSLMLVLLLGCTSSQPAEAAPARDHVASAQALEGMTVALVQDDGLDSLHAYCTGVWVSSRTILTALHCVEDEALIGYVTHEDVYPRGARAVDADMHARGALVVVVDDVHDLALLRAFSPPTGHGVAHTRIGTISQGMFAQTMGQSLGLWWTYSSGDVSAIRQLDMGDGNDVLWVQTSAPTSPGNSGCGLFDSDGALIGLAHATASKGQQLNFYVHADYVSALIARATKAGML